MVSNIERNLENAQKLYELIGQSTLNFTQYLQKLKLSGTWSGTFEIYLASLIFQINIQVYYVQKIDGILYFNCVDGYRFFNSDNNLTCDLIFINVNYIIEEDKNHFALITFFGDYQQHINITLTTFSCNYSFNIEIFKDLTGNIESHKDKTINVNCLRSNQSDLKGKNENKLEKNSNVISNSLFVEGCLEHKVLTENASDKTLIKTLKSSEIDESLINNGIEENSDDINLKVKTFINFFVEKPNFKVNGNCIDYSYLQFKSKIQQ